MIQEISGDLKIMIGDREDFDEEVKRFLRKPELVDKEPETVLFLTPEQLSSIFTSNKIKLMKTIEEVKPKTMNELAKRVKRPQGAVSRDVNALSRMGLIKIRQRGSFRKPEVVNRRLSVCF